MTHDVVALSGGGFFTLTKSLFLGVSVSHAINPIDIQRSITALVIGAFLSSSSSSVQLVGTVVTYELVIMDIHSEVSRGLQESSQIIC